MIYPHQSGWSCEVVVARNRMRVDRSALLMPAWYARCGADFLASERVQILKSDLEKLRAVTQGVV
jgi:hypothetical protein